MSLLNDALRKRTAEQAGQHWQLQLPSTREKPLRRVLKMRKWRASILVLIIVAAASSIAWLRTSPSEAIVPIAESNDRFPDVDPPIAAEIPDDPRALNRTGMNTPGSIGPVMPSIGPGHGTLSAKKGDTDRELLALSSEAQPQLTHSPTASALAPAIAPQTQIAPAVQKASASQSTDQPQERPTSRPSPGQSTLPRGPRPDINPLLQKAKQYHRQNQIPRAIALYREALVADPMNVDARFNLTSAYIEHQEYFKAYDMASELFLEKQDDPNIMLNLAIADIGCGRPRQALELLNRLIELPGAPRFTAYLHKGIAMRRLNDLAGALDSYETAARLRPDDPHILFNTALVRDQLGEFAHAVDDYRRYLLVVKNIDAERKKLVENRIATLITAISQARQKDTPLQ